MDKYEFNIKVEQIKKLVGKSDFQTAMKIADTIDWRRVRNANLLSMIASVYEKNEEYQEAKDILLIAFERAPVGKRLLYKLTQLAIKQGNIQEAESYYREFCELAGDDSRQDVLRYLILKAKGASMEQLIHSLESYTSTELDEKWLYELAELYHQAGMKDKCVQTCDKIMLMFGLGQYVDKAMELKLLYAPLTKYQMDLVENRDKYEEKLRMVEQSGKGPAMPVRGGALPQAELSAPDADGAVYGNEPAAGASGYENMAAVGASGYGNMAAVGAAGYGNMAAVGAAGYGDMAAVGASGYGNMAAAGAAGYGNAPVADAGSFYGNGSAAVQGGAAFRDSQMPGDSAYSAGIIPGGAAVAGSFTPGGAAVSDSFASGGAAVPGSFTPGGAAVPGGFASGDAAVPGGFASGDAAVPGGFASGDAAVSGGFSGYGQGGLQAAPSAQKIPQKQPESLENQGMAAMPQAFAGMTEEPIPGRGRTEPKPIPVPPPSPQMYEEILSAGQQAMHQEDSQEEAPPSLPDAFVQETSQAVNMGVIDEEKLVANLREAEVEASLAEEMSKISMEAYSEEPVKARTRVLNDVKELKEAEALAGKTKVLGDIRHIQDWQSGNGAGQAEMPVQPMMPKKPEPPHMMVQARTTEIGLAIALDALKRAHQVLGYRHPVAKISGEKLNQKGILASAPKLAGKDLIIEDAGDLTDDMLEELDQFLENNSSRTTVVLVDNSRQISGIRKASVSLADKFHEVASLAEAESCLEELERQNYRRGQALPGESGRAELNGSWQENVRVIRQDQAVSEEVRAVRAEQAQQQRAESARVVRAEQAQQQRAESARVVRAEQAQQQRAESARIVRVEQAQQQRAESARIVRMEPVKSVQKETDIRTVRYIRENEPREEFPDAARENGSQSVAVRKTAREAGQLEAGNGADKTRGAAARKAPQEIPKMETDEEEVMGIDDFAQYCCQYASQIDCNITGKSMLALYERIEIMEEEGVALTKTAAEDLIEEAADKAEKPSLGKRITGLFSSKYDKEGLLILKEEHFI